MQTCKDIYLQISRIPTMTTTLSFPQPILNKINIPSGTYVERIRDRFGKEKLYRVKSWRGMPKEYKELIDEGVVISHAYVKGKF